MKNIDNPKKEDLEELEKIKELVDRLWDSCDIEGMWSVCRGLEALFAFGSQTAFYAARMVLRYDLIKDFMHTNNPSYRSSLVYGTKPLLIDRERWYEGMKNVPFPSQSSNFFTDGKPFCFMCHTNSTIGLKKLREMVEFAEKHNLQLDISSGSWICPAVKVLVIWTKLPVMSD